MRVAQSGFAQHMPQPQGTAQLAGDKVGVAGDKAPVCPPISHLELEEEAAEQAAEQALPPPRGSILNW